MAFTPTESQAKFVVDVLLSRIKNTSSQFDWWVEQAETRLRLESDEGLYTDERAGEWVERIRAKMQEWGIDATVEWTKSSEDLKSAPAPSSPYGKPALTGDKTTEPPRDKTTGPKDPNAPVSQPQENLVVKLLKDLEHLGSPTTGKYRDRVAKLKAEGNWRMGPASAVISQMIEQVKRDKQYHRRRGTSVSRGAGVGGSEPSPKASRKLAEVPVGRYALEWDGRLQFFQVTQNRSKTFYYGYRLTGSPGDFRRHQLRFTEMVPLFEELAKDPMKHMRRFGHEFTICGRCAAPLTDTNSRIAGFGPDCAQTLGVHHAGV